MPFKRANVLVEKVADFNIQKGPAVVVEVVVVVILEVKVEAMKDLPVCLVVVAPTTQAETKSIPQV